MDIGKNKLKKEKIKMADNMTPHFCPTCRHILFLRDPKRNANGIINILIMNVNQSAMAIMSIQVNIYIVKIQVTM